MSDDTIRGAFEPFGQPYDSHTLADERDRELASMVRINERLDLMGAPSSAKDEDGCARVMDLVQRLDALDARMSAYRAFVEAYDAWATSPEPCGGPLFDAMLAARDALGDSNG